MTTDFRPILILPVYNHGQSFADMLPSLNRCGLPLIAIDDGSTDDTPVVLQRLAAEHPELTVLTHEHNEGKGGAVATGLRQASASGYSHALQIDADGQHAAADIERFLEAARDEPDAVILGRPVFDASIPTGRRLGRYLTHFWIWVETVSFDIADAMCGFRVYPLAAVGPLLHVRQLGRHMDFDPEILVRLHWRGTRFITLDTPVVYPEQGYSNFRMFRDNLLITAMHIRLVCGMLIRLPRITLDRLQQRRITKQRTDSAHWPRIAERGTYFGLKFMLMFYQVFGRWLFRPIAWAVAGYFALSSRTARAASEEFLHRVWEFSDGDCGLTRPPDFRTSLKHFGSFADAILDKVAAWRGEITLDQIDHENLELFEERLAAGRGGIWVTSHLGNIEVCRAIGQQEQNMPLTVLMHTRHAENFNRLLRDVAPERDVELMEVTEFNMATAMRLKERVDKGRFIIIVGDRVPVGDNGRTLSRNFLGKAAAFPIGPFLLAALLDCPAGTLFCVREDADVRGKARYRIFIGDLPSLAGIPRRERMAAIEDAAETFVRRLEALCLRYPLQWFNFFPFWSEPDGDRR